MNETHSKLSNSTNQRNWGVNKAYKNKEHSKMLLFRDVIPYAWFGNIMNCRKQFFDNLGIFHVKITMKNVRFILKKKDNCFTLRGIFEK